LIKMLLTRRCPAGHGADSKLMRELTIYNTAFL